MKEQKGNICLEYVKFLHYLKEVVTIIIVKMNAFEFVDSFIKKEIEDRKKRGHPLDDLKIRQCVIRLIPNESRAIVEFNDEIGFAFEVEEPFDEGVVGGDIYLHNVPNLLYAKAPRYKGKRVKYFFLYYNGVDYSLLFDARYSGDQLVEEEEADSQDSNLRIIAKYYNLMFTERVIKALSPEQKKLLFEAKYFATPSILPYPFNFILQQDVDVESFEKKLEEYFDKRLLHRIEANWFINDTFNERKTSLESAIKFYKEGEWDGAISIMIRHVEGTMRSFINSNMSDSNRASVTSALNKIQEAFNNENKLIVFEQIIEAFSEIMGQTDGFMASFMSWTDNVSDKLVSRHAHSHGKYDEDSYNKRNCIKLFLILDTIFYMITLVEGQQRGGTSLLP